MRVGRVVPHIPIRVLGVGPVADDLTVACGCIWRVVGVEGTLSALVVVGTAMEGAGYSPSRIDRGIYQSCAVDIEGLAIEVDWDPVDWLCRTFDDFRSWSCNGDRQKSQKGKVERLRGNHGVR